MSKEECSVWRSLEDEAEMAAEEEDGEDGEVDDGLEGEDVWTLFFLQKTKHFKCPLVWRVEMYVFFTKTKNLKCPLPLCGCADIHYGAQASVQHISYYIW